MARLVPGMVHAFDVQSLTAEVLENKGLIIKCDDEWVYAIYFDNLDECKRAAEGINNLNIQPTTSTEEAAQLPASIIDEEIPF